MEDSPRLRRAAARCRVPALAWGALWTALSVLAVGAAGYVAEYRAHPEWERAAQCRLIRDIFGDPSRPAVIKPAWLAWNDGTIPGIASAVYEGRSFDRMPILGDALEDAGCDDRDILRHCRSRGAHVRGCWVVDAILGKS